MAKKKQKKKKKMPEQAPRPKDFLDTIAPAAVKFNTDHFILGSRYHTAMALKSYPPMTDELALLRGLGDMGGVNLRLTARQVTPAEEDAILHAATNKSRMERSNTNDYKQSVTAEANLRDMAELLAKQRQEKEPLIHCGVYLDIAATDTERLRAARDTVSAQLVRSRMGADPLLLRQREGFLSANPAGGSQLANFAERVLPARSVANLYPMNYSGKTDPKGFFIGRDRFGSNIIVDFDRRAVGCDLVVTGEGSFDAQSLGGKAISGVAGRCQKLHVPAAVLAGRVALTPEQWAPLDLRAVHSINPTGATLEDARVNAAAYYRTALETLLKEWK